MTEKYILLATCKDKVGITSLITNKIAQYDSNILHLDHFTEYDHSPNATGQLYLRLEFENVPSLKENLETTLQTHQIDFKLFDNQQHTKIALLFLRKIMLSTKFYYVLTEMNCLPKLCVSLVIMKTIGNSQKRFIFLLLHT